MKGWIGCVERFYDIVGEYGCDEGVEDVVWHGEQVHCGMVVVVVVIRGGAEGSDDLIFFFIAITFVGLSFTKK